jgi:hypothetical protein
MTGDVMESAPQIVPGLPRSEQRTSSLRLGDLLRTQVNLTPGNILFASFLANSWNAPETGLGPLDPPPTTSDQRVRTWQSVFGFRALGKPGAALHDRPEEADSRRPRAQVNTGAEVHTRYDVRRGVVAHFRADGHHARRSLAELRRVTNGSQQTEIARHRLTQRQKSRGQAVNFHFHASATVIG